MPADAGTWQAEKNTLVLVTCLPATENGVRVASDKEKNITAILLGKWNAYEELLLNESIKPKRRKEIELRASQLHQEYMKREVIWGNKKEIE